MRTIELDGVSVPVVEIEGRPFVRVPTMDGRGVPLSADELHALAEKLDYEEEVADAQG